MNAYRNTKENARIENKQSEQHQLSLAQYESYACKMNNTLLQIAINFAGEKPETQ